ncbi:MAG: hypothetical protein Q9217_001025 [Psora testacea]
MIDAAAEPTDTSLTLAEDSHAVDAALRFLQPLTKPTITGAFLLLVLLVAYLGLGSLQIPQYWIFDSTRRRIFNLTLLSVTVFFGIGSEGLQGLVTNRQFDPLCIAANIVGSLSALGLCTVYHKRMLDRRRRAKGYGAVPQEGEDLELEGQETGVVEDGGEGSTDVEARLTPSNGVGDDGIGGKN